jgi:hypothetical protein
MKFTPSVFWIRDIFFRIAANAALSCRYETHPSKITVADIGEVGN